MHDANAFLTLTYSNENLPEDYSLDPRELQLFMKRLRKWAEPRKLRFFACGEYGDENLRPHYHAIIFGEGFDDRQLWRKTPSGNLSYRSSNLEKLWTLGHCEVMDLTEASAGYIARYVTKKIGGELAESHYRRVHPLTGLVWNVRPEFALMSRKPGIGGAWFDQFAGDAFPSDFVVLNGSKRPVPDYYTRKLDEQAKLLVAGKRKLKSFAHKHNNTPERLAVREEVLKAKTQNLKRDYDNDT